MIPDYGGTAFLGDSEDFTNYSFYYILTSKMMEKGNGHNTVKYSIGKWQFLRHSLDYWYVFLQGNLQHALRVVYSKYSTPLLLEALSEGPGPAANI